MKGNLFMLACAVSLVAVARENPVAIVVSGGRSQVEHARALFQYTVCVSF